MVRTAGATETDAGDEGEATAWNTGFKRLLLKRTEALRSVGKWPQSDTALKQPLSWSLLRSFLKLSPRVAPCRR